MKKNNNHTTIILVLGIFLFIIFIVGISYGIYIFARTGSKENVITTGEINVDYAENNKISLINQYPMNDTLGIAQTGTNNQMEFTITSNTSEGRSLNYAIALDAITEGVTLKENYVKVYLLKGNSVVNTFTEGQGKLISDVKPMLLKNANNDVLINNYVMYTDTLTGTSNQTYTLKAWVADSYDLPITNTSNGDIKSNTTSSETFSFKIKVIAMEGELIATNDSTPPSCTWETNTGTTPINNNGTSTFILDCTDNTSLNDITLTSSNFTFNNQLITITNISKSTITNGYKYTITVAGETENGLATLTLNSNSITDTSNNYNEAVTSTFSVLLDNVAPSCTWSGPYRTGSCSSYPKGPTLCSSVGGTWTENTDMNVVKTAANNGDRAYYILTCTDNNDLSDQVALSNIVRTNTTRMSSIEQYSKTAVTNGYKYIYKVNFGTGDGDDFLTLPATTITDTAGNSNNVSNSRIIIVDNTVPTLSDLSPGAGTYYVGQKVSILSCDPGSGSGIAATSICDHPNYQLCAETTTTFTYTGNIQMDAACRDEADNMVVKSFYYTIISNSGGGSTSSYICGYNYTAICYNDGNSGATTSISGSITTNMSCTNICINYGPGGTARGCNKTTRYCSG